MINLISSPTGSVYSLTCMRDSFVLADFPDVFRFFPADDFLVVVVFLVDAVRRLTSLLCFPAI